MLAPTRCDLYAQLLAVAVENPDCIKCVRFPGGEVLRPFIANGGHSKCSVPRKEP